MLTRETLEGVTAAPEQIQTFAWNDEKEKIKPIFKPIDTEILAITIPTSAVPKALPKERMVCTSADAAPTSR